MRKRLRHWTIKRREQGFRGKHLAAAATVGLLMIGALFWATREPAPPPEVEVVVVDAGPPCPYLLRLADTELRCDPAPLTIDGETLGFDLLMPPLPESCRPIVSDTRGRLYPLQLSERGKGFSGQLGPLPQQAEPYTLRFIAWDERVSADEACAAWAEYTVSILHPEPPSDAGPGRDAGAAPAP